ncbi:CYP17A1 [Bugula neritina]|uniref:CYP17A1 n=1 Tax=Bugula neritina TaxID=10212 RepID=A0A7J7K8J6_BUGNE|nr:CYP17A1 [Bugula neritina]
MNQIYRRDFNMRLTIPAGTTVVMNAFYTAHNPRVYDEPFKVKPERFLDENGNLVPPGHPARYKCVL